MFSVRFLTVAAQLQKISRSVHVSAKRKFPAEIWRGSVVARVFESFHAWNATLGTDQAFNREPALPTLESTPMRSNWYCAPVGRSGYPTRQRSALSSVARSEPSG